MAFGVRTSLGAGEKSDRQVLGRFFIIRISRGPIVHVV